MDKKFEQRLEERIGRDAGFRVPDGYFEAVFAKVEKSLPERKVVEAPDPSIWQKVRPYIYLAAMFAGLSLMLKTFHTLTHTDLSLDNVPVEVVQLASAGHPEFYEIIASSEDEGSSYSTEKDLAAMYDSFREFEEDFHNADASEAAAQHE